MHRGRAKGTDDVRGRMWALALALSSSGCLSAPPLAGSDPPADGAIEIVAQDPFGDGTAVAHLFVYRGWIHVGPSRTGDRLLRLAPDGDELEEVSFELPRDATGNTSRNPSSAPYRSIGYTGCRLDVDCGPDDEDGGGLFAPALLSGRELLVAGGARSAGDVDYVYATDDSGPALAFRYADLSAATGPMSRGFSALHGFADRVYLGVPDTGGERPYLLALLRAPSAPPGLDAASGTDVLDLEAHAMPALASEGLLPPPEPGTAIIDAIGDFAGNLYVANASGWVRSTVSAPRPFMAAPSDWADATPSSPDYLAAESVRTDKTADLEPADRAVPALAVHRGRLYAARNTAAGPQLWSCDPALTAPASACDPGDWRRVTGIGEGSAAISLLVATPSALYVGFDDPAGFRLFRTAAAIPATELDFEQISEPGLGESLLTRIFSAVPVADGLVLVAGDGVHPLALLR